MLHVEAERLLNLGSDLGHQQLDELCSCSSRIASATDSCPRSSQEGERRMGPLSNSAGAIVDAHILRSVTPTEVQSASRMTGGLRSPIG